MAMNTGTRSEVQAQINMTPMIDVLLVLLIIFLSIAPVKSVGQDALVPQTPAGEAVREPENPVVLEIGRDGAYRVNTELVTAAQLADKLIGIFSRRGDRVLFLKAAPELEFGVVAVAIDAAHGASVSRVGLMPR